MIFFIKGLSYIDWLNIQWYIEDVLAGRVRPARPLEECLEDAITQIY